LEHYPYDYPKPNTSQLRVSMTPKAMETIEYCKNLRVLDLGESGVVNDYSLRSIARLANLESLNMAGSSRVSVGGLHLLGNCERLHSLNINNLNDGHAMFDFSEALVAIAQNGTLAELKAQYVLFGDEAFGIIFDCCKELNLLEIVGNPYIRQSSVDKVFSDRFNNADAAPLFINALETPLRISPIIHDILVMQMDYNEAALRMKFEFVCDDVFDPYSGAGEEDVEDQVCSEHAHEHQDISSCCDHKCQCGHGAKSIEEQIREKEAKKAKAAEKTAKQRKKRKSGLKYKGYHVDHEHVDH